MRFVVSVPNTTSQGDGIYIDEVAFTYNQVLLGAHSPGSFTFVDTAQSMANWVTEGTWGIGYNYFYGGGTSDLDFGPTTWTGTYFDCEKLAPTVGTYSAGNCGNTSGGKDVAIYNDILEYFPNTTYPDNSGDPSLPVGPEIISEVNFNWGSTQKPLNNATTDDFKDTFTARWRRNVSLAPGTYNFSTISDDGVRLWIDDYTGTDIIDPATVVGGTPNSRYIINNWGAHGPTLNYGSFTVTGGTINRTLTLEFFENGGGAVIILNATGSSYSFTDSPDPAFPTLVNSVFPGNSSIMLNGYFDLTNSTTPSLTYRRLYQLNGDSNAFYVDVSNDGGFTWSTLNSETLTSGSRLPPGNDWDQRIVSLSSYAGPGHDNVMIRFRLDTRTATTTTDGVYISDVHVSG